MVMQIIVVLDLLDFVNLAIGELLLVALLVMRVLTRQLQRMIILKAMCVSVLMQVFVLQWMVIVALHKLLLLLHTSVQVGSMQLVLLILHAQLAIQIILVAEVDLLVLVKLVTMDWLLLVHVRHVALVVTKLQQEMMQLKVMCAWYLH